MKLSWALILFLVPLALFASEGGAAPAEGEGSASKKPLPPPAVPAPENINTFLHLKVNNLTKALPPQVQDRKLLLTWKGDMTPRYVAAAFQHEAFRQKHLFWRNQNGVYFLVMDLPNDAPSTLQYRLVVDGLWLADPTNSNRATDPQGVALSQVALKADDLPAHDGPQQGYFGEVTFSYRGKPGQQVSLVGNFNQWDPFANYLEESHPGEYHLTVALPPGTLAYRFVVGTKSVLDPGNAHTGHDALGDTFSYFENKLTQPARVLDAQMALAPAHH